MESSASHEIEDVMEIIPRQVTPGDLSSGETEEPPASASLPPTTSRTSFTFGTIARSLQLVPIEEIIPYDGIPDYREPTTAEHPIIVVTPRGKFCIEGQNLVRVALLDEMKEILCEIEVMEEHSDVELSLRKAGSRIATRGGLASYPEIVRNVTAAKRQLETSGMDLRVFGHGGRRFGQGFVNEPQADIKHILALRFTRKPKTILNYLSHGEDLSVDALEVLVERDVQRHFFEEYRSQKQSLVKELKKKGLSEAERQVQVSASMLEFLALFLVEIEGSGQEQPNVPAPQSGTPEAPASAPGSQGNAPLQATLQDEEEQGDAASESEDEGVLSDENGDDQEPSEHPQTMTREDVDEAILAVAERLGDLPNLELSRVELIDSIRDEIDALTQLVQQLDQLQD